ncbi:MAG: magnesium protoporphyrin IX methyltransferase [Myxococcota bacterium]
METATYQAKRSQLEEYFDRTAVKAWAALTSDAPVGRIRATVRAGRNRMRETLLGYLPENLEGQRVLDAGCGTGALAVEAALRGAEVVAIDISPTLIQLARERTELASGHGTIDFRVGDMSDPALGTFDWVVAMDSLIHYEAADLVTLVAKLGERASQGLFFTFAPSNPLLSVMHAVGKAFPRGSRSPNIAPIAERALREGIAQQSDLEDFTVGRSDRVESGFYTSQTLELLRA